MTDTNESRWSRFWKQPQQRWRLGIPIGGLAAFALGAIALGIMNYTLHATSTTEFCYACHSHEQFIKPEYEASSHFANQAGVRAECADCHLPQENWFDYVWTKAVVSMDIFPELMGKLDTADKYESHRAEMAESVWREYMENDSAYCRTCHTIDAMDLEAQDRRTARRHSQAEENNETCIDCHYGLVHNEPENADEIIERLQAEFAGEFE